MILADPGISESRHWVAWDHGIGNGQSVHLALCTTPGVCIWHKTWPHAYSPVVTYIPELTSDNEAIFLLILDYGAEAQDAEIYGLREKGLPKLLDHRSSSQVSLTADGEHLHLRHTPDSVPAEECLGWATKALKLEDTHWTSGLLTVLFSGPAVSSTTVECPASLDGHPFLNADLFDGAPSQLASLEPADNGWRHLGAGAYLANYLSLVCEYSGIGKTIAFQLPSSTGACLYGEGRNKTVACKQL